MVVTPLTPPERLWTARHRRRLNQDAMADSLGVDVDTYRAWEAGQLRGVPRMPLGGRLRPHEVCRLLRRRAGLTQSQLALLVGVTRFWVVKMEVGDAAPQRLLDFWEQRNG